MDDVEEEPPYQVIEFFYGRDIDSEFSVVCRCHRFVVQVSQRDLREEDGNEPSTIEADYQRLLTALDDGDPSGIEDLNPEDYDPLEVIYHWIATPFFPLFRKLPSITETPEHLQTLDEYANPPTLFFQLKSVQGRLTPIPCAEDDMVPSPLVPFLNLSPSSLRLGFPTFSPREIQIPWDWLSEGALYPRTVLLKGGQKFYLRSAMDPKSAQREIDILHRIQDLDLHDKFRLPKLHAYVKYENQEHIVGYLLCYIDHQDTLGGNVAETAPVALRRNWYRNIADTVGALHDAGIVWGDAKADNVLLDHENNTWVIDFEGGRTEGWVDEDRRETIAGDLQGLSRIREYLKLRAERPDPASSKQQTIPLSS